MRIKVALAFSNSLFAEGVAKLIEHDSDLEVCAIVEPGHICSLADLEKCPASVILTDFTSLYNSLPDMDTVSKKHHVLLLDTCCGKENLVSAILRKKVSGVLMSKSDPALLKKAIKAVHKGEIWLDKNTFKSILHGINAINGEKTSLLSAREKEIVSLIGKGLRNKEIASRLNITETTVKTHLTRIFQKLNIKARSELISYAIKTDDLNNGRLNHDF
ncbi:MAG TPA: response regulator transcription factor [Syntrophales bacterium]|nr:response regulator transcription factor [Syntrophales bacterium]